MLYKIYSYTHEFKLDYKSDKLCIVQSDTVQSQTEVYLYMIFKLWNGMNYQCTMQKKW